MESIQFSKFRADPKILKISFSLVLHAFCNYDRFIVGMVCSCIAGHSTYFVAVVVSLC